jgi:hypothetical protein
MTLGPSCGLVDNRIGDIVDVEAVADSRNS